MRIFFFFIVLSITSSCGQTPTTGNEIVFGDVIGSYEGQCASYDVDNQVLENREDATMSVFAANLEEAGVNASCDRFEEFRLKVTVANSSMISFVKAETSGAEVKMTYFSASDSISLSQEGEGGENIIFRGIRK